MPSVLRTRLDLILPLILTRLQTVTGLDPAACFLSQAEEMPYDGMAPRYVWVRVEDESDDQAILDGGGRIDARETQILSTTVRTRMALDSPGRDAQWLMKLTETSMGHLRLVHYVKDALTIFTPTDDGNIYTVAPMRPVKGGGPRKDKKQTEWGEKRLWWALTYMLDLDQTYQG